jgi:selenocysteine lyase/cysteine desulfurase
LAELEAVHVYSRAPHRTPTLLLTIAGYDTVDAYRYLAENKVHAPSGSFYAIETSRHLGLGDAGGLRVGLAPYSEADDVERLLSALTKFVYR